MWFAKTDGPRSAAAPRSSIVAGAGFSRGCGLSTVSSSGRRRAGSERPGIGNLTSLRRRHARFDHSTSPMTTSAGTRRPRACVALFRGVNVGRHGAVPMSELTELLVTLGLKGVRTYIRSGNVVFAEPRGGVPGLASRIEAAFTARFGFASRVLVVVGSELARIADEDPLAPPDDDPDGRYVTFLMDVPEKRSERDVRDAAGDTGNDVFAFGDGCVYLSCPDGYGSTRLSNGFFEKALGVAATTRNRRTVVHLIEMAEASED